MWGGFFRAERNLFCPQVCCSVFGGKFFFDVGSQDPWICTCISTHYCPLCDSLQFFDPCLRQSLSWQNKLSFLETGGDFACTMLVFTMDHRSVKQIEHAHSCALAVYESNTPTPVHSQCTNRTRPLLRSRSVQIEHAHSCALTVHESNMPTPVHSQCTNRTRPLLHSRSVQIEHAHSCALAVYESNTPSPALGPQGHFFCETQS